MLVTMRFWTILDENSNFFQGPLSQKMYFIDPPLKLKVMAHRCVLRVIFVIFAPSGVILWFSADPQLFSRARYQILFSVKPPLELKNRTYKGILEKKKLKKEFDIGPQKKVRGSAENHKIASDGAKIKK